MFLESVIAEDEQRAANLNTAKAAIEAEHLMMVRRVFKSLPDPLPDQQTIRAAFKADPEYKALSGRNVAPVMRLIVDRCLGRGWGVPPPLASLDHWNSLYVKWHWHCAERLRLGGDKSVPELWAGRGKSDVERTSPLLRTPRKRKPSRNYWFDHSPFRIMFGNQTCGMSWFKEDFAQSRTFILTDGDRILVGIVPRQSRFCPYTIPDPEPGEPCYGLYEESRGEHPVFRPIPKSHLDLPEKRGLLLLFELDGRALRGKSNLNACYLRALFSPENMRDPVFHLDGNAEFHVRKGTELPRAGKPERFRQRFTEDAFFVTFRVTLNSHMVSSGETPQAFTSLSSFISGNPCARFVKVSRTDDGGYAVSSPLAGKPTTIRAGDSAALTGLLARQVVEGDLHVLFAQRLPQRIYRAVADKFAYVVLAKDDRLSAGGVLRGYQLRDRLFIGDLDEAQAESNRVRTEYETRQAARREKAERKAFNRARNEEERRLAALRRSAVPPNFDTPLFQTGRFRFKVEYKTSDNARHEAECRADSRDEMFAKARTVGVRPSRVTALDTDQPAANAAPVGPTLELRLKRIDELKAQGLISSEEHVSQRNRILSEI